MPSVLDGKLEAARTGVDNAVPTGRGLSVGSRIMLAIAVVALATVATGVLGLWRMHELNDRLSEMRENNIESLRALDEVRAALADSYAGEAYNLAAVLNHLPDAGSDSLLDEMHRIDAAIDAALASWAKIDPDDANSADLRSFRTVAVTYRAMRDMQQFHRAPPPGVEIPTDRVQLGVAFVTAQKQMQDTLDALVKKEMADAAETVDGAEDAYQSTVLWTIVAIVVGLVLAVVVAWLLIRRISRSLRRVSSALAAMAAGDLTTSVEITSADELGAMAASVNEATGSIRAIVQALAGNATALSENSARLTALSGEIGESAEHAKSQAGIAAAVGDQVSAKMHVVASGADEMGSSIGEISRSVEEGVKVAAQAVSIARSTNDTVAGLGESSAEIGSVIKTITSIAAQTNLLALNATIEAARAGDAGKGFAVVAGEVKDLAQETAQATDDIAQRVEAIQINTGKAIAAIGEIGEIIRRINGYQTTIASAVEEQHVTTGEMARGLTEVVAESTEIISSIGDTARAAEATAEHVGVSRRSAEELANMAGQLRDLVSQFRY